MGKGWAGWVREQAGDHLLIPVRAAVSSAIPADICRWKFLWSSGARDHLKKLDRLSYTAPWKSFASGPKGPWVSHSDAA